MKYIIYSIVLLFLGNCATVTSKQNEVETDLQYVSLVDRDGIYLHDVQTGKKQQVYKTDRVFRKGRTEFLNDSILLVAHQGPVRREEQARVVNSKYLVNHFGDSVFITDNPPFTTYDEHVFLTETVHAINLNSKAIYTYKTQDYEHIHHWKLNITTSFFDANGRLIEKTDTSYICRTTSSSYGGITFGSDERYFSQSELVNGRQIISSRGNLYLVEGIDTSMLLEYGGKFDPKFGSGYYAPTLSPDGNRVAFQHRPNLFEKNPGILELDIKDQTTRTLVSDSYFTPRYSPDGQKLLLGKDHRSAVNNTWINSIYIYDQETGKVKKVGNGIAYLWRPMTEKGDTK